MTDPTRAAIGAVRDAMRKDDRLDDLTRARVWGQLARALDEREPRLAAAAWRRWALAAAVGALVALAGVAIVVTAGRRGGGAARRAEALDLPPGAQARVQLGAAAAITLHGPARLDVDRVDRLVEVRLVRGELVGAYDHAAGGRMRIRTPHAVVDVIGTAFAVEVGAATCVAVAHGTVEVRAGAAAPRRIGDRQRWCTDAIDLDVMPAAVGARIAAHEHGAVATQIAPPAPPTAAPSSPPPIAPPSSAPPSSAPPSSVPPSSAPPSSASLRAAAPPPPPSSASPSPAPLRAIAPPPIAPTSSPPARASVSPLASAPPVASAPPPPTPGLRVAATPRGAMTRARLATLRRALGLVAVIAGTGVAGCTEVVELHRPPDAAVPDAATWPDAPPSLDAEPAPDAHPLLDAAALD